MIDFRYHIVSLISVFLALAVGIVLGAGPLKEAIGDQLTGQVEGLRTEKEEMRASLDQAEIDLNGRDAFLAELSSDVLANTLPGRRVALVEMEEIPQETIDELSSSLEAAGALVTMQAELGEDWFAEGQGRFRQSFASSLIQHLDPAPNDQGTDTDFAAALAQSLTSLRPGDENSFSESAKGLQDLLVSGEFVNYKTEDALPADMIVLVSLPPESEDDVDPAAEPTEQRANAIRIQTGLAQAAAEQAEASVVVSVSSEANDLLTAITSDKGLAGKLSTVARGEEPTGQINMVLALAAGASGESGQFGDQDGASAAAAHIVRLAEVDRTERFETVPEAPDGLDEDATEDEGATEDEDATEEQGADEADADDADEDS